MDASVPIPFFSILPISSLSVRYVGAVVIFSLITRVAREPDATISTLDDVGPPF